LSYWSSSLRFVICRCRSPSSACQRIRWTRSGMGGTDGQGSRAARQPPSVRKARVFTSDVLAADGVDASVIELAVLLVSELVTNAIHGRGMICLTVDTDPRFLRIEVDEGRALPVRRPAPEDDAAARRLLVVDEFASAWGTERRATHEVVWFEIAR
jgi:hypothetical protein